MAKLCLNMIVRNEAARIVRCLNAVIDHIDCAVISDTGSTDGTQQLIRKYFKAHHKPLLLVKGRFENFEQARNDALRHARICGFQYDYILFCDADMELKVDDPDFKAKLVLPAYHIIQKAGGVAYHNLRIIHRSLSGEYRGVTHEYLDITATASLENVWYLDHADGSNRVEKFKRDIALLEADLKKDPNNERSWFYLAQSYRDAGMNKEAAEAYLKRAEMGGWDEEAWNARVNYAHCLKDLGDEAGFIRNLLEAYNQRPQRGEPLYDLAKHYRDTGKQLASLVFSEAGLQLPYPKQDVLFVSEFAHTQGVREEFAICAFYDEKRRERGFQMSSDLTLDPNVWESVRNQARSNMYHYLPHISKFAPSFKDQKVGFTPPDDYTAMNPSVTNHGNSLYMIVRTVNYTITPEGRYSVKGDNGDYSPDYPIHTRNFLCRLSPDLAVETTKEIKFDHKPEWPFVVGYEDSRLFHWRGALWTSSTVRDMNPEGWCEQVLARVAEEGHDCKYVDAKRMLRAPRGYEKNWMPICNGEKPIQFMYRLDDIVDENGNRVVKHEVPFSVGHLSGGSQVIPFRHGWLALIHEANNKPGSHLRYYQHRFAFLDHDMKLQKLSLPFYFNSKDIEFAAGLAWCPEKRQLVISYGYKDAEARIATVDAAEVQGMIL